MGSRSSTDTLVRVFLAFLQEATWKQADLARHCGIGVPALRRHLREMREHGVPLESEDDPPHVYWSVTKSWFPGGAFLARSDVADLLRVISRSAASPTRTRVIRRLIATTGAPAPADPATLVVPVASQADDTFLPVVEEAAERRIPLRLRYFSQNSGTLDTRHVSVHRVLPGPPARVAAVCHRAGRLKWFRLDGFASAILDEAEPFRDEHAATIDSFVDSTLDGFHSPDPPIDCSFFVRDPEARWVERNLPGRDLPGKVTIERTAGGTRFVVTTAGLPVLARFVVGLGDAAHAETPHLATLVRDLARGSLAAHRAPARGTPARAARNLSIRQVRSNKTRGW